MVNYELCETLYEPIVVISQVTTLALPETYGFVLTGEPYLFINANTTWPKQRDTIFHEAVHYVQIANHVEPSCEAEQEARDIAHQLSGYPKVDNWERMYRFCDEE